MNILPKLFIIFIYILSCKADESFQFMKIGEVEFKVGYLANHRYIGFLNDTNNKINFFYSGDPTTHKKISFFDLEGNPKFVIPLNEVIDSIGNIGHFEVISTDTFRCFRSVQQ